MAAFVYLICWTQDGALTKYGMTGDPRNRKEWERWARAKYRDELRIWGNWSRAYAVPMTTAGEAKDWEILMGKIANLRDLKRKHPWRHKEAGKDGEWCLTGDETIACFNEALQQFAAQGELFP